MPASHEAFAKIKRFLTEEKPPKPDTRDPDQKVFAKGWNFIKIFTFFVIGCVVGTYYEEALWFIRFGERVSRKGVFYGPFSPIYGLGFAIFIIFLGRRAARDAGQPSKTFIGEFFDRVYPDEYIQKQIPAMIVTGSDQQTP